MPDERRAPTSSATTPEDALEARLGHRFRDRTLLEEALTHASGLKGLGHRARSNERLEFLGDRVLGLVVAERLLQHYPEDREGALGKRLAHLVSGEVLAEVAAELELSRFLRLGRGEEETGLRRNPGVLADCLEAVIGALYLDGGLEVAARFVERHWSERIRALATPPRDPKTALQEWAQGRGLPVPSYRLVDQRGPAHAPLFRVEVQVEGYPPCVGEGRNKRAAERAAARKMLKRTRGRP